MDSRLTLDRTYSKIRCARIKSFNAGARVMLQRPQQRVEGTSATTSRRAVELYIEVDNVNEYHDQVKKRRVQISDPLTDQMMNILPAGFSTFCLKK